MEVKINREIREYSEAVFFGLTMRQCVCSVLAIATAVALYFLLRSKVGLEVTSWACILGATPFAVLGFVRYHGMPAEKFLWVWFRSEILEPRYFTCKPVNLYCELLNSVVKTKKGADKADDEEH